MVHTDIVDEFLKLVYNMQIVPVFDWMDWNEGINYVKNKDTDFSKLNIHTLCKLLTVITRADRFNEGFLVSCFETRIVSGILKVIKHNLAKTI